MGSDLGGQRGAQKIGQGPKVRVLTTGLEGWMPEGIRAKQGLKGWQPHTPTLWAGGPPCQPRGCFYRSSSWLG